VRSGVRPGARPTPTDVLDVAGPISGAIREHDRRMSRSKAARSEAAIGLQSRSPDRPRPDRYDGCATKGGGPDLDGGRAGWRASGGRRGMGAGGRSKPDPRGAGDSAGVAGSRLGRPRPRRGGRNFFLQTARCGSGELSFMRLELRAGGSPTRVPWEGRTAQAAAGGELLLPEPHGVGSIDPVHAAGAQGWGFADRPFLGGAHPASQSQQLAKRPGPRGVCQEGGGPSPRDREPLRPTVR
jgi:hypothetical protein